jgi:hypothetical protein
VNEPDGQRSTVRPQASFSFFAKAFLSDEVGVQPRYLQNRTRRKVL